MSKHAFQIPKETLKSEVKKLFTHVDNDVYKCSCGKILKQKHDTEWSFLMQHFRSQHGQKNSPIATPQTTLLFMHCRKSETIYGWLGWVCLELKPFAFESEYTRKYSKLGKISMTTLEKYMNLVSNRVERELTRELHEKLSLMGGQRQASILSES